MFCLGNNMLQRCSYTGYLQFAGIKEGWPLTLCFIIHRKHAGIQCKWPSFHTVLLTCEYKSLQLALRPWLGPGTQLRGRVGWGRQYPFLSFPEGRRFPRGRGCLVPQSPHRRAGTNLFICEINRSFSQTVWLAAGFWGGMGTGHETQMHFTPRVPFIYLFIYSKHSLRRAGPSPACCPTARIAARGCGAAAGGRRDPTGTESRPAPASDRHRLSAAAARLCPTLSGARPPPTPPGAFTPSPPVPTLPRAGGGEAEHPSRPGGRPGRCLNPRRGPSPPVAEDGGGAAPPAPAPPRKTVWEGLSGRPGAGRGIGGTVPLAERLSGCFCEAGGGRVGGGGLDFPRLRLKVWMN